MKNKKKKIHFKDILLIILFIIGSICIVEDIKDEKKYQRSQEEHSSIVELYKKHDKELDEKDKIIEELQNKINELQKENEEINKEINKLKKQ